MTIFTKGGKIKLSQFDYAGLSKGGVNKGGVVVSDGEVAEGIKLNEGG